MSKGELTHTDEAGRARMVDVGSKTATARRAEACGRVLLGTAAFERIRDNKLGKGDALAVARLAGIQAAKRTSEWIPLCHTVPLDHVDVTPVLDATAHAVEVRAVAAARWTTGVEMEALVAVAAACLAIYDMAKAVDRSIRITDVRLVHKSGGRSGEWRQTE